MTFDQLVCTVEAQLKSNHARTVRLEKRVQELEQRVEQLEADQKTHERWIREVKCHVDQIG